MRIRRSNQRDIEAVSNDLLQFVDLCAENIMLLYRKGKASPRATDEYGRSIMHHLSRSPVRNLCSGWMSWRLPFGVTDL